MKRGMLRQGLIPNLSYNEFVLGADISGYLSKRHRKETCTEESFVNDCYYFYREKTEVWCDLDGCINTIRCGASCIYNGVELIGMNFPDFLAMIHKEPDSNDSVYLLVNGRGQNQQVYEFEEMGLQIWVWRKKIRTVMVYKS